jgi:hypothetical protein
MAQLGGTFDANEVQPQQAFDVLPPGDYKVQIVQSDMVQNKAGTGQYLWLEMDIVDGEYQGRKVWDRLNLVNPNQQAQDIAQRQLSAICHAIGQLSVQDSEELHFKTFVAQVKVKPRQDTGENTNEVKGYKPADEQRQAAPASGQQKRQPEMAGANAGGGNKGGGSTPPWKR